MTLRLKLILVVGSLLVVSKTTSQNSVNSKFTSKEFRQFDFWIGEWDVNLRVKQKDHSWKDETQAIVQVYSILEGKAILELWEEQDENDYEIKGYSLRYYNPKQKEWELYLNWPSPNNSATSTLTGNFRHGRGIFESHHQINDSTKRINRYTFSDITEKSLRWDDSYSTDAGKTWTHQWIMEFTRRSKQAPKWQGESLHTYEKGGRCGLDAFEDVAQLSGLWKGTGRLRLNGKTQKVDITWKGYKVLDDCGMLGIWQYKLEGKIYKEFDFFSYNTRANLYELTRLDNTLEEASIAYGINEDGVLKFRARDREKQEIIKMRYEWKFDKESIDMKIYHFDSAEAYLEAQLNTMN